MQIRTRLTLLFTCLVAALLLVFAVAVYLTSAETREEEYFKRLRQQAATKANLLLDTKVTPRVLQLIYKNTPDALFQEEVAVYDTSFRLLYHDAVDIDKVKETRQMMSRIIAEKEIQFYLGDVQVVGFLYRHNGSLYVITAAAKDEYGLTKLAGLRRTILISLLVSLVIVYITGRFLATKSLQPVSSLVSRVKEITASRLNLRVEEGNRKDEIAALAITFNEMLDRLEGSFEAQKQFVSNISHELRTPLTAMLAELQLTRERERNPDEYRQAIDHTIADSRKLIRLSNSLLDLAKAHYDKDEISFRTVRLDEVLLDARTQVLPQQPGARIDIVFDQEIDEENDISVNGNEYLLKVAFHNLMENACKFSRDSHCLIHIAVDGQYVVLRFEDQGPGIPDKDLQSIFTPFFRGANGHYADGNGIGLPLTRKIVELHQGRIRVESTVGIGTRFFLSFPHLSAR